MVHKSKDSDLVRSQRCEELAAESCAFQGFIANFTFYIPLSARGPWVLVQILTPGMCAQVLSRLQMGHMPHSIASRLSVWLGGQSLGGCSVWGEVAGEGCAVGIICEPRISEGGEVTDRRTRTDWARVVKELVDVNYADKDRIVLVMDNPVSSTG